MSIWRGLLAGSFLLSIAAMDASAAGAPVAKIESGRVSGHQDAAAISYLGIPYAAPPVGTLRWRAPQPAPRWQGIRAADTFGADCMQQPIPGDSTANGRHSEDCLYLNIWRPAAAATHLPVMVWIHGGGFVNGGSSASIFNGVAFAKRGVILVSLNYRLGRFGFFAFPALTRENPDETKGNYGYMDQIAALKWVQRNIAAFGGDPHNVTIFGESAGGGSVHTLLTSPLTEGLFQKAIIESGGGRGPLMGPRRLHEGTDAMPSAETIGLNFAKVNGIDGEGADALAALRALPADRLVAGLSMQALFAAHGPETVSGPMVDGRIITASPDEIYGAGKQHKVPVLVGANDGDLGRSSATSLDEVFASFGDRKQEARDAYDPQENRTVAQLGHDVAADRGMIEPARLTAQLISAQGVPAYEYRFSYVSPAIRAVVAKSVFATASTTDGARHASELAFVFDTVATELPGASTADEEMAQAVNAYWTSFAKSGDPNDGVLPDWPRYNSTDDQLMNFTVDGPRPMADPWRTRLDLVEKTAHP